MVFLWHLNLENMDVHRAVECLTAANAMIQELQRLAADPETRTNDLQGTVPCEKLLSITDREEFIREMLHFDILGDGSRSDSVLMRGADDPEAAACYKEIVEKLAQYPDADVVKGFGILDEIIISEDNKLRAGVDASLARFFRLLRCIHKFFLSRAADPADPHVTRSKLVAAVAGLFIKSWIGDPKDPNARWTLAEIYDLFRERADSYLERAGFIGISSKNLYDMVVILSVYLWVND